MFTLPAYAKVNLVLEVLGTREDGYHQVATVMQTISLQDTLSFQEEKGKGVHIECSLPELATEDNLAFRAARLLRETTGVKRGVRIFLRKGIPVASGLGGGSSDAAATLKGLNELWGTRLSLSRLAELGKEIGSDVPFSIYGGTALVEGRGEKVTPLPPFARSFLVVVEPPQKIADKTAQLYARLQPAHFSRGEKTEKVARLLSCGEKVPASLLHNAFDPVAFAFFPGLEEYRQRFLSAGAGEVHLSGSGPALFTLVSGFFRGEALRSRLESQGIVAHLAYIV